MIGSFADPGNAALELQWPSPRTGLGACRDTCLPLLFGAMDTAPTLVGTGPEVTQMSELLQDRWITFIRGGNPWTAYDEARRTTMLLGAASREVAQHRCAQRSVWDGRYPAAG